MGFLIEGDRLLRYESEGNEREVTIPDGVHAIRCGAFAGFAGCIIVPESVKRIDKGAFVRGTEVIFLHGESRVSIFLYSDWSPLDPVSQFALDPEYETFLKIRPDRQRTWIAMHCYRLDSRLAGFVRSRMKLVTEWVIGGERIDLLLQLLDDGLPRKKDIRMMLDCAIAHTRQGGSPEAQVILTRYLHETVGGEDPNRLKL